MKVVLYANHLFGAQKGVKIAIFINNVSQAPQKLRKADIIRVVQIFVTSWNYFYTEAPELEGYITGKSTYHGKNSGKKT